MSDFDNLRAKKDLNFWNKSNKNLSSRFLNLDSGIPEEKDEIKKEGKDSSNFNNSTLSLHIACYENSIEATNDILNDENECLEKKNENSAFNKTCTNANVDGSPSLNQNIFEFPRQKENEKVSTPEIAQFKASQKLLNPNTSGISSPVMDFQQPPQFRLPNPTNILPNFNGPPPSTSSAAVQAAATVPFYNRPGSRFKPPPQREADEEMADGPGRRLRKNVANVRKHIDYSSGALNALQKDRHLYAFEPRDFQHPHLLSSYNVLPVQDMLDVPADCACTRFARAATNKVKCPVYTLCAHDVAIRAIKWSSDANFMASADHNGFVKYWQPNMNNVNMFQAHKDDPVRGLTFSPTNIKIATASDDGTARIFDFENCTEERVLRGHGSDVRCIDWHSTKGLIVTGSRDSQQPVKLWDPRTGNCLATLHDHKNSVTAVKWNKNGHWLLSGSRDHLIKLYDIRMMNELFTFKGHRKEVVSLAWHPIHETLFVSGGGDGSIGYWLAEPFSELGLYDGAHDQAIWALDWHPLGHILSTGSNDNNTKFWGRNRPGDTLEELNGMMASAKDTHHQPINNFQYYNYQVKYHEEDVHRDYPMVPGLGVDEHVLNDMKEISILPESIPGSTTLPDDYGPRNTFASNIGAKRTLIKQPPPKKAQRQFERTWTTTKPGSDTPEELMPVSFISPPLPSNGPSSTSLLGAPRPSLLPRPGGASLLGRPTIPQAILEQQSIPLSIIPPQQTGGESWRTSTAPVSPPIIIKEEPPQWFPRPGGGYPDGSTFQPPPPQNIGFPPPHVGARYGYDGPEHPYPQTDPRKRRADDSEDPGLNGNGKIHRQY
uniref:Uncharacterized protein n=1 Tax=Panagrolaimus sp. ES5 TaxID=591445 RepID=A0AC34GWV4_9BILA